MTFGEYLAQRSGLASGTLMQHLAAIQGTGTGTGQTIYCSQITTLLEQDELAVTRKAKRAAPQPVNVPPVAGKLVKNNLFAFAPKPVEIVALYETDEITVTQRNASLVVRQPLVNQIALR